MIRKIAWRAAPLLALIACSGGQVRDVSQSARDTSAAGNSAPVVLFMGTSLTAGLGVEPEQAYAARIQQKIDSAGLAFRVVNAGVSGETSAGGLRRIGWLLRQPIAVFVLELGANDGLRGVNVDSMRGNLQAIIDSVRSADPTAAIVIAGMEAPPNMGERYAGRFRAVFPELARRNHATLVPFLLQGVGGIPSLNQADGIHPNARGHEIVAENVWDVLEPLLRHQVGEVREVSEADAGVTAQTPPTFPGPWRVPC